MTLLPSEIINICVGVDIKQHATKVRAIHLSLLFLLAIVLMVLLHQVLNEKYLYMIEAAKINGFETEGINGAPEYLTKIPKPNIAHVVINVHLQYFVVLY